MARMLHVADVPGRMVRWGQCASERSALGKRKPRPRKPGLQETGRSIIAHDAPVAAAIDAVAIVAVVVVVAVGRIEAETYSAAMPVAVMTMSAPVANVAEVSAMPAHVATAEVAAMAANDVSAEMTATMAG